MKTALFLTLFSVAQIAVAQVPGYLGKKVMLGFTANYSPSYWAFFDESDNFSTLNYQGQSRNMFLNALRVGGNLKFVISQHGTFNLGVSYQETGLSVRSTPESYYQNSSQYYQPSFSAEDKLTQGTRFLYSRASFITISMGLTTSNATAPIGFYTGGNALVIIAKPEAVNSEFKVYPLQKGFDFGWNAEFGYRRVIGDQLVIETGVDLAFHIIGLFGLLGRDDELDTESEVAMNALGKNYLNNLCTARLGVFYLLPAVRSK